jgi:hypothetical protein
VVVAALHSTVARLEWCDFFRENNFLIGPSLDSPREMHEAYCVDKGGKPTFDKVMRAAQAINLAKQMPEKLHELQRLWLIEAVRYNVLPLDDDLGKMIHADTAGRPVLIRGNSQILFGRMGRLAEN